MNWFSRTSHPPNSRPPIFRIFSKLASAICFLPISNQHSAHTIDLERLVSVCVLRGSRKHRRHRKSRWNKKSKRTRRKKEEPVGSLANNDSPVPSNKNPSNSDTPPSNKSPKIDLNPLSFDLTETLPPTAVSSLPPATATPNTNTYAFSSSSSSNLPSTSTRATRPNKPPPLCLSPGCDFLYADNSLYSEARFRDTFAALKLSRRDVSKPPEVPTPTARTQSGFGLTGKPDEASSSTCPEPPMISCEPASFRDLIGHPSVAIAYIRMLKEQFMNLRIAWAEGQRLLAEGGSSESVGSCIRVLKSACTLASGMLENVSRLDPNVKQYIPREIDELNKFYFGAILTLKLLHLAQQKKEKNGLFLRMIQRFAAWVLKR